ncbi:M20 family metallopeptidase [Streptomyces sp.]|uniref:M20 family metallopeptidase n=1 Tax=Streptomyces sp. TaxID=1931 RepID=UPI002D77F590|nr:M20/M25/M40 family metallo-hydrolase [Streptomyces sp.]HET6356862.1 M20/M25/M40 family metallo-hydrolase [Streptomyces sp.]
MDFDGLLGARRRAARNELAEAMRTLSAQQEPESTAAAAPPEAFYEPRLYSQLVLGGFQSMTADQLLLAADPGDRAPRTVASDEDGIVYFPGLGRYATEHPSAELTVRHDPADRALTVEPGNERYPLDPISCVPGTDMELVDRLDPVLRGFLELHIDRHEELAVIADGRSYLPRIKRALDLIAEVSPAYHQALSESIRAIFLYEHPTAESFAALGMHGMIFLNVPEDASTDYFVEELVHQGGHVLFSEATLSRGDFFRVDPEAPLSELIGQEDPRNVYDAFHGLFTEHMEYRIVLGVLERELADAEERPALERHLVSVARRHLRDLRLIEPHAGEIFTALGEEVFTAFRGSYDQAARRHPGLFDGTADAEDLLRDLIAIPSVNPLLPGSEGLADERDLAAFVADRLRAAGIDVEAQEVADGRCNVIAHLPRAGEADDHVILLSAHMDTYPAGGPRAGYEPVTDGRDLYGRGSADAKGSLAAMMTAFLQAAASPNRRESYLAATVDEECLLLGARGLTAHGMRPTLGITGEPTRLAPVVAQKGIIRGSFLVRGPQSHAAYPTDETAVGSAAELVHAVAQLNATLRQGPGHAELGVPTVTVTRLDSTGGMNLSATEVAVRFDARFLPGTSGEEFASRMERELRELLSPQVDFALERLTFVSPPNEVPPASPLVSEFFTAVKNVVGACEPETFSYGSEAGVLAEICRASLVFGPGDAGCSHAETEVIDLDELTAATKIFRSILVGDHR